MESNDKQVTQLFESIPDGVWGIPQPVVAPELHEIIRRIYDENLTEDMLAPKMKYDLLRLLLPSCPHKVITNAKKNQSNLKDTNLQYHLLKLVPRLFIAALHYRNYDRAQAEGDLMEKKVMKVFDNRFQWMIECHLKERDTLYEQIMDLETGKGYVLEADHYREIKELKRLHREELEEETYQVAKKKEKEKVEMEMESGNLKHAIRMLEFKMKCDYVPREKTNQSIVPCLSQQPKWKVRKD